MVLIPNELHDRLAVLANKLGLPLDECVQTALVEFAENWEDHILGLEAVRNDSGRQIAPIHPFSASWLQREALCVS